MNLSYQKAFFSVLALSFFQFFTHSQVLACNTEKEICSATSEWTKVNFAKFEINDLKSKMISSYIFHINNNNDFDIDITSKYGGQDYSGSILVISGTAMIAKGFEIDKRRWIDYLDRPVLMLQLVYSLLDQAFPDGPSKTSSINNVVIKEKNRGIKVATIDSSGLFGPPWELDTSIQKFKENNFAYDMNFQFYVPRKKAKNTYKIKGTWEALDSPPSIKNNFSIKGWDIFWLNRRHKNPTDKPTTVGEVRNLINSYKSTQDKKDP